MESFKPKSEPGVNFATVRDGGDEWQIECRFADGQKFAAITVAKEHEQLADFIARMLSPEVVDCPDCEGLGYRSFGAKCSSCRGGGKVEVGRSVAVGDPSCPTDHIGYSGYFVYIEPKRISGVQT